MSPYRRGSAPVGSAEGDLRRGSAEHRLEECRTRGSVYVGVVRVRERSHVHVPIILMLVDVVTKH